MPQAVRFEGNIPPSLLFIQSTEKHIYLMMERPSLMVELFFYSTLAHLLGIKLMPRIRNWKDLIFYRPTKEAHHHHLMPLFNKGYIDWALIEMHWQDMMQVVLSIKAGKVLPSTLFVS